MKTGILMAILGLVGFGCATSPTGRKQLLVVSEDQMNAMGAQSFQEVKGQTPESHDPALKEFVSCVAKPITKAASGQTGVKNWEIVVFDDPKTVNAFALPGGKIGVYTGLLKVTANDAQLAAVLGHEVGHVIAKHSAERVSDNLVLEGGLSAVDAFVLGKSQGPTHDAILSALGLGAQVGVMLPFSRAQESEADLVGLDLMARAGFDPRQSVELWKNMTKAGGEAPPEFLSTHPSNPARIENLSSHLSSAQSKYEQARNSGLAPSCKEPALSGVQLGSK